MSVFEISMLVCFGAAWPFSIYRSWKSGSSEGKSTIFLFIIMAGYLFGMLHKMFFNFDRVIFLYLLNFLMVAADTLICIRNSRESIEPSAESALQPSAEIMD